MDQVNQYTDLIKEALATYASLLTKEPNNTSYASEDAALWHAVEAEQAHRRAHPEDMVVYRSMEELATALDKDE